MPIPTDDPESAQKPGDDKAATPTPPEPLSDEGEHIEEDGEPLGGNFA